MSKANDRQVGGDHYSVMGKKLQHWDVARLFNFDPMQYQITKHVFRWKDKFKTFPERLADLEKALHYLQKYIEDAKTWDDNHVRFPAEQVKVLPRSQWDMDAEYTAQMAANVRFEADGFVVAGTRYQCKACRFVVTAHSPLGASALHPETLCEIGLQTKRMEKSVLTAPGGPYTVSGQALALISANQEPSGSANGAAAPTPGTQLLDGS